MLIGRADPRLKEVLEMQGILGPDRLAVFLFNGGHEWAPPEIFGKALDWIENRARP
jgi:hypothetical protein